MADMRQTIPSQRSSHGPAGFTLRARSTVSVMQNLEQRHDVFLAKSLRHCILEKTRKKIRPARTDVTSAVWSIA